MFKIFEGNYDKGEFYSLMGKFFAERKYRKMMPYLVNEDNRVWYLVVKNNEVVAFITYIEKLGRINIGYCYIDSRAENSKLIEHNLITTIYNIGNEIKDMYVDIEKGMDKEEYINLGFEIYKETTNYWFLVKKAKLDI